MTLNGEIPVCEFCGEELDLGEDGESRLCEICERDNDDDDWEEEYEEEDWEEEG